MGLARTHQRTPHLVYLAWFLGLIALLPARSLAQGASQGSLTWEGGYVGSNAGLGLLPNRSVRLGALPTAGFGNLSLGSSLPSTSAPSFGFNIGYNWQAGQLIYGVETGLDYLGIQRGLNGLFSTAPAYAAIGIPSFMVRSDPGGQYLGSFRGRLGFAVDRSLFYVTAGVANGGWRGGSTIALAGSGAAGLFNAPVSKSSQIKFVAGGGLEFLVNPNWSARAEYLLVDQAQNSQLYDNGNGQYLAYRANSLTHLLRFGMTYRIGSDPAPKAEDDSSKPGETPAQERFSIHAQVTDIPQYHPSFPALYSGPNSLKPYSEVKETLSTTGFFGLRLWDGGEAYLNPEIGQGFGVSNTLGVAGFPNMEAFKVGRSAPYLRFQRYFFRQTIGLGGATEQVESGQNLLQGSTDSNRLIWTVGKYAVTDIFDDNKYAHDSRNGFLNWTINDLGAFDYAADSWGYTYGATLEWKQDWWTARAGVFQLSDQPNSEKIEPRLLKQFMPVVEFEARHSMFGEPGKIKLLAFADRGYMGKYEDAILNGVLQGSTPDISADRRKRTKAGAGINVEQQVTPNIGLFLRASIADGRYETFDFTEVERSFSGGLVFSGDMWGRPKDAIGVAGVVNGISGVHASYLAAGGTGIILGDGTLSYTGEKIAEIYYKFNLLDGFHVTANYQFVEAPGYNRDRGPVSLFALRFHGEF